MEQLITDKNIIINKQRKINIIITLFLLLLVFFLIIFTVLLNKDEYKEVSLENETAIISLKINDYYEDDYKIIKYEGGYIYQKINVKKINYTDNSNLYLINVQNDYTNGYMAYMNDEKGFNKKQYTKKAYMNISFALNKSYFRPLISWHQKNDFDTSFVSYMGENMVDFDIINLNNGAILQKYNNNCYFHYESPIYKMLLDNEYKTLLRTCNIDINYYYSSWEYTMVDEIVQKSSFTINSSYLIEAVPNQTITFNVDTIMSNTNMSVKQKRIIELNI